MGGFVGGMFLLVRNVFHHGYEGIPCAGLLP